VPQRAWREDEMIGGKPPVVKYLWLWLWDIWSNKLVVSCEMVASRQRCKHVRRRIYIAGNRNGATISEHYNSLKLSVCNSDLSSV
jgi:hypothetical protein